MLPEILARFSPNVDRCEFLLTVRQRAHLVFGEHCQQDKCRHLWRDSANVRQGRLTVHKYTANCHPCHSYERGGRVRSRLADHRTDFCSRRGTSLEEKYRQCGASLKRNKMRLHSHGKNAALASVSYRWKYFSYFLCAICWVGSEFKYKSKRTQICSSRSIDNVAC